MPFAGGKNSVGEPFPGHEETVNIWQQLLRCTGGSTQSQYTAPPDSRSSVEAFPNAPLTVFKKAWSNCSARGGVTRQLEALRIQNGQHFANPGQSSDIFQRALGDLLGL